MYFSVVTAKGKELIDMIIRLYKSNVALAIISKSTNLTEQEVLDIINQYS